VLRKKLRYGLRPAPEESRRSDGDSVIERAVAAGRSRARSRRPGAHRFAPAPRRLKGSSSGPGPRRSPSASVQPVPWVAAAWMRPSSKRSKPTVVEQEVDDPLALEVAALHQHCLGAERCQPLGGAAHVGFVPHRKAASTSASGRFRRQQSGHRQQRVAQCRFSLAQQTGDDHPWRSSPDRRPTARRARASSGRTPRWRSRRRCAACRS